MSNEFVMVPREKLQAAYDETVDTRYHQEWMREVLSDQHQGEPVAWLTKCKHSGLVEQAEPNEKASNPEHWTDAFPVYDSPKSARSQFDYDRGFAAGTAECETLRAQLAERDALLRDIDDWLDREDISPGYIIELHMSKVFTASAEPSAPVEITDEQIIEAMRSHLNNADGGYVVDTAPDEVVKAGRALLARDALGRKP